MFNVGIKDDFFRVEAKLKPLQSLSHRYLAIDVLIRVAYKAGSHLPPLTLARKCQKVRLDIAINSASSMPPDHHVPVLIHFVNTRMNARLRSSNLRKVKYLPHINIGSTIRVFKNRLYQTYPKYHRTLMYQVLFGALSGYLLKPRFFHCFSL